MKLPYGVADFYSLRREGQVYVDRTSFLAVVESLGQNLLFLRPRRFGKSLWLSTLAAYHDLRLGPDEHERLFGGLEVSRQGASAPEPHRRFVLHWDFSNIDPNPPLGTGSRARRIGAEIHGYLNTKVKSLASDYREHLPEAVDIEADAFRTLENLLAVIRQTPYRLYLLIDEYDNFANEILAADQDAYTELVTSDGPFKRLFKWIKAALGHQGIDRLFVTGVSPLVMSDVTSGMNVIKSVFLDPELNTLCGFTGAEVRKLLEDLYAEKTDNGDVVSWTVDTVRNVMRDWYNGYRFTTATEEQVYNPTLVFYFLDHLQRTGTYPEKMLDANLAADEGKLEYLAQAALGKATVIDMIRKDEPLEVPEIRDHFTLREMLEHSAQDESFFGSYLYYFGMLTLAGRTPRRTWLLETPNEVVRGLYIERIRRFFIPQGADRKAALKPSLDLAEGKPIEPFLDFIEATLFPTFSNRDALSANELTVKTVFLTLLWNESNYITYSEPELDHRYADLCLLRRPDARASSLWDLLFEFKRLSLEELGMSGKDVKSTSREALMEVPVVKEAFEDAEEQLSAYRKALERRYGDVLRLRTYAVVALGFERLVVRKAE